LTEVHQGLVRVDQRHGAPIRLAVGKQGGDLGSRVSNASAWATA